MRRLIPLQIRATVWVDLEKALELGAARLQAISNAETPVLNSDNPLLNTTEPISNIAVLEGKNAPAPVSDIESTPMTILTPSSDRSYSDLRSRSGSGEDPDPDPDQEQKIRSGEDLDSAAGSLSGSFSSPEIKDQEAVEDKGESEGEKDIRKISAAPNRNPALLNTASAVLEPISASSEPANLNLAPELPVDGSQPEIPAGGLTPADLVQGWNDICAASGLPTVRELTGKRRAQILSRLKEHPEEQYWETVLNNIADSPFCRGLAQPKHEGEKPWKADFDWLIRDDTNCVKAYEGKYNS